MFAINPSVTGSAYPADLAAIVNLATARESADWLARWPLLRSEATPLYDLPGLARHLGVAELQLKDESVRSPLASFKALGAPIALVRLLLRLQEREPGLEPRPDRGPGPGPAPGAWLGLGPGLDPARILTGAYREQLERYTVISATDGNHGRALAAAAQSTGCGCVILIHEHVSVEREQAIAAYGADVRRIAGTYDDSVREAARLAEAHGWHVVSDTSYEGYTEVPRDVMQGYSIIATEAIEQRGTAAPFTHVLLQGGVGGFAAGVASALWEHYGAQRPHLIVVEPEQADCLFQSAVRGRPAAASGSVDSVMAGLACGEASPLAWQLLEPCIDAFLTVTDEAAVAAMRAVAQGAYGDVPVVGGESGVAGLAGLIEICSDADKAAQCSIDAAARVLVINTEGATAPGVYEALAEQAPSEVLARQEAYLTVPAGRGSGHPEVHGN